MWVMTRIGFFSVVEDRNDPNGVLVRGRVCEDLRLMSALIGSLGESKECPDVVQMDDADYQFRIFITKQEWSDALAALAKTIDYDNFNHTVDEPLRHQAYMDVWSNLRLLEDLNPE
jgi:hypothetical protein